MSITTSYSDTYSKQDIIYDVLKLYTGNDMEWKQ